MWRVYVIHRLLGSVYVHRAMSGELLAGLIAGIDGKVVAVIAEPVRKERTQ